MIETLRRTLFDVRYPYRTIFDRERAVTIVRVIWLMIFVWAINFITNGLPAFAEPNPNFPLIWFTTLIVLPFFAVLWLVQKGRITASAWLLMGALMTLIYPVLNAYTPPTVPVLLFVPLIAASALLPRRQQWVVIAILLAALLVRFSLQAANTRTVRLTPAESVLDDVLNIGISFVIGTTFLVIINGRARRFEERSTRSSTLLRAVGGYRALVSGIYDDERIFIRALEMLQIDLRYTLATAYRLNEIGMYTRLRLGLGQEPSRAEIRLADDPSALGEAMRRSQTMIVSVFDGGALSAHLLNPARWSITLPVIRDGVLLGVLDVQTARVESFDDEEREAFGILVDQIAGALIEARDFRELRRINREQEELMQRYRGQIVQSEQRGRQMFTNAWDRYVQGRTSVGEAAGFGFDLFNQPERGGTTLTPASDLPAEIQAALAAGDIHVERTADAQLVRAPVVFRNQTLGALSFRVPNTRPLTDRQLDLLRTVATRLGVALENNRLFEQSQVQAARERKVGEIGSTLITATDIESVLNMAARTFNEALGAVSTRVTLEPSKLAALEQTSEARAARNGSYHGNGSTSHPDNGRAANGDDPERNGQHP
jgi:GAF domain-containing protein